MNKAELRKELRERRRLVEPSQAASASLALRDLFLSSVALSSDALVAVYVADDGEIDPAPLVEALKAKGHRFCLPCEVPEGQPLRFRAYDPEDRLGLNRWAVPEPLHSAPFVVPDVLLIPLVAFDKNGRRLGRGGGYYDRTLAQLRSLKKPLVVGLAYAMQEVGAVPSEAHDAHVDAVVTEKEVFFPAGD